MKAKLLLVVAGPPFEASYILGIEYTHVLGNAASVFEADTNQDYDFLWCLVMRLKSLALHDGLFLLNAKSAIERLRCKPVSVGKEARNCASVYEQYQAHISCSMQRLVGRRRRNVSNRGTHDFPSEIIAGHEALQYAAFWRPMQIL